MGFFDQPAAPEPPPLPPSPPRPAWIKPEAALPAMVATGFVLARTADAVVAVTEIMAYPAGFEFTLAAVLRAVDGRGPVADFGMHHHRPDQATLPDEFLRVGVRFADGRTATNVDRRPPGLEDEPSRPILMSQRGGGGRRRNDMTYWVWPLPPAGPLSFGCEWPARGIPETFVDMEGALIIEAATRAVQLWPENSLDDSVAVARLSATDSP